MKRRELDSVLEQVHMLTPRWGLVTHTFCFPMDLGGGGAGAGAGVGAGAGPGAGVGAGAGAGVGAEAWAGTVDVERVVATTALPSLM